MRVNVHIERLVVDGLDMTSEERRGFDAALRSELARLLAVGGVQAVSGTALSAVIAPEVRLGRDGGARRWGEQIASAIHASLAPAGLHRSEPRDEGTMSERASRQTPPVPERRT